MVLRYRELHAEVLAALEELGNPILAAKIGPDRRSNLEYSGIRVPVRRARVSEGFSFYDRPFDEILAIWDDLWMHSPNGDVKFCAIDYYRKHIRANPDSKLWFTMRNWVDQVDNWAHSDDLCAMYSWIIESYFDSTIADIREWNRSDELWRKRISIVCLVRPGINSTYLPPEVVFPLVETCVDDRRDYMQKATGWVLREMLSAYPQKTSAFLDEHLYRISASVLTRTLERHEPESKRRWCNKHQSRPTS